MLARVLLSGVTSLGDNEVPLVLSSELRGINALRTTSEFSQCSLRMEPEGAAHRVQTELRLDMSREVALRCPGAMARLR